MKTLALAVAALALVACGEPEFTVHSAPELEAATEAAVMAWNDALTCGVYFRRVRQASAADVRIHFAQVPGDHFGSELEGDVEIDADAYSERPDEVATAIAHELGHVLVGHEHSKDPSDLMYPDWKRTRGPEPTAHDVARACGQ